VQRPKANSLDLEEISCTHSTNLKKNIVSQFLEAGRGETSLKNKMNNEKLKIDQIFGILCL